ncbi:MAG: hypothetical protein Salg2KO_10970 [Salibacteraceae bacterium]
MKKLILLFSIALSISLVSCDDCRDVTCLNGGTCVEGICECPIGFSGATCELEDKCLSEDVDCQNGGTCDDGDCDCPNGFSGDECQIEDRCITQDPNCLNGGDCVNGECDCPEGYTGDRCETLVGPTPQELEGDWDTYDQCTTSGSAAYTLDISLDGPGKLLLTDIYDGFFFADVEATYNGFFITIPEQDPDDDDYLIEGTGRMSFDKDSIYWDFTITDPALFQDFCDAESER